MSREDVERLKQYALELYSNEKDEWEHILLHLVALRNANINDLLIILVKNNCFYPAELYVNASSDISKLIIEKINMNSNSVYLNHALRALAWVGDEVAIRAFKEWSVNRPKFSEYLYVEPEKYTYEAGWKIDINGNKKELFVRECYGIKLIQDKKHDSTSFLEEGNDSCGWCKNKLRSLFKVDLNKLLVNSKIDEEKKINISTCEYCTCYGVVYTDYDYSGKSMWSDRNEIPEYLQNNSDEIEACIYDNNIYIDKLKKNYNYGISWFLDHPFSKIGGYPTWIQDAEYPKCNKCNEDMSFIGQVSMEDVMEYGEGIYYGFICDKCKVAATIYQQS